MKATFTWPRNEKHVANQKRTLRRIVGSVGGRFGDGEVFPSWTGADEYNLDQSDLVASQTSSIEVTEEADLTGESQFAHN